MDMVERERQSFTKEHADEVRQGKRFEFGKNWSKFLNHLSEEQIIAAEKSLRSMLELSDLAGKSFLDVGSGSGLFSLAARRLGAQVHSFDYDPQSVACTKELRRRYSAHDQQWRIEQESVLDVEYVSSLGRFDVVYSWGVLHHTGAMWQALEHVHRLVAKDGLLFIAIYNNTGTQSVRWRRIKQFYNVLPVPLRMPYTLAIAAPSEIKAMLRSLAYGRPRHYIKRWTGRWTGNGYRGMNCWRDTVDWIGGYPYEVAKPEEIFEFFKARGFTLRRLKSVCDMGCNEYVFGKTDNLM
jgi:2-polyprenyl-3-methyl-5-hydroxy-6-metoxy-1,4-benzoquinol methylase